MRRAEREAHDAPIGFWGRELLVVPLIAMLVAATGYCSKAMYDAGVQEAPIVKVTVTATPSPAPTVTRTIIKRASRSSARTRVHPKPPSRNIVGRSAILACIRKAEGSSWTSVSPSGKYRGAYQADRSFWITYGGSRRYLNPPSWERASKAEQSAVAWRGYLDRGYQPWPPAMRECS